MCNQRITKLKELKKSVICVLISYIRRRKLWQGYNIQRSPNSLVTEQALGRPWVHFHSTISGPTYKTRLHSSPDLCLHLPQASIKMPIANWPLEALSNLIIFQNLIWWSDANSLLDLDIFCFMKFNYLCTLGVLLGQHCCFWECKESLEEQVCPIHPKVLPPIIIFFQSVPWLEDHWFNYTIAFSWFQIGWTL